MTAATNPVESEESRIRCTSERWATSLAFQERCGIRTYRLVGS